MRIILLFSLSLLPLVCGAQQQSSSSITMNELLRKIPTTIIPQLTHTDILDLADIFEAGLKAEVDNQLGGKTCLTALSADSAKITLSNVLSSTFFLCDAAIETANTAATDSISKVIVMVSSYTLPSTDKQETTIHYFTTAWEPLNCKAELSQTWNKRIADMLKDDVVEADEVVRKTEQKK